MAAGFTWLATPRAMRGASAPTIRGRQRQRTIELATPSSVARGQIDDMGERAHDGARAQPGRVELAADRVGLNEQRLAGAGRDGRCVVEFVPAIGGTARAQASHRINELEVPVAELQPALGEG